MITLPPINLRATMREPSSELVVLLEKLSINKNIMISVFDYAFLPQFYSFYHNSILPLSITNYIAFALDKKSFEVHFIVKAITRFYNPGLFHLSCSSWTP